MGVRLWDGLSASERSGSRGRTPVSHYHETTVPIRSGGSLERRGGALPRAGARPLLVALLALLTLPLAAQTAKPTREPDILFVPTREAVADQMLQLARVVPQDVVYDLGSGDGRIVNLAAQKYGARGVGIEMQPHLVAIARQVARDAQIADRVTFIEGDLFTADISKATIVTLYLSYSVNRRLEAKLKRELRPGTRVVSHQFPIGNWPPDRVERAEDGTDLYLWTIRKK